MRTLRLLMPLIVGLMAMGLSSCGVSSVPPFPVGDFNLSISSQSLFIPIGSGARNLQVSVQPTGGFNQPVMVWLFGLPEGVTTTPASPFTLAPGGSQAVTFSATPGTSPGVSTITVAGIARATEASLYHSGTLSISVADPVYSYLKCCSADGSTIASYAVDANTGSITAIDTFASGLAFNLVAAVTPPRSRFIYVPVSGEQPSIATYSVDRTTGILTPGQTTPLSYVFGGTSVLGGFDFNLVASPDGKFLYVVGATVAYYVQPWVIIGFQVDPATGTLTQSFLGSLPGVAFHQLVIPSPGNFAYFVTEDQKYGYPFPPGDESGTYRAYVYTVSPTDGSLSPVRNFPLQAGQDIPNAVFSDPLGRALYLTAGPIDCLSLVTIWAIDQGTGELTPTASDFTTPACLNYYSVTFDPGGKYMYVSATNQGDQTNWSSIYGARVDSSSGALTNLPDSPFAVQSCDGFCPLEIAVEPSQGKLLLRVESGIPDPAGTSYSLASYAIDPKSGALSRIGGPTLPSGHYGYELMVVAPKN